MTRWLPWLVGTGAALAAVGVVLRVPTHLFPGGDAVVGVLGALALGYAAKTLAAVGLSRRAPTVTRGDDD